MDVLFVLLNFSTLPALEWSSVVPSGASASTVCLCLNSTMLMSEFMVVSYGLILECLRLNPQMQLMSEFSPVHASESSDAAYV